MIRLFSILAAVILCCPALSAQTGTITTDSLRHKGNTYTYHLYRPANLPERAPLLLFFHGYGSRSKPERFGLFEIADRHGFAICFPRGLKDFKGKACWDVGYEFHRQKGWKRDDTGFACRLVRHLQREHNLSRHNVFVTGHSNGGEMCYLLAYLHPERFAAVAPVSGLTMEWMHRELKAKKPIPLFEIHGTLDKTSLWEGDPENIGGWGSYIAVPKAVEYWRKVNDCRTERHEELPQRRHKIIAHKYSNGINSNEVWLYEIVGGGHSWADKDLDIGEHLWLFFSKFLTLER